MLSVVGLNLGLRLGFEWVVGLELFSVVGGVVFGGLHWF